MVATIRALKLHGGQLYEDLDKEDIDALVEVLKTGGNFLDAYFA